NHIHWQRFEEETDLLTRFDVHLPSHHTGLMKPDLPVYAHAIEQLGVPATSILFMDDNQINVDAARQSGMQAELTRAPQGVREVLAARALIDR
ncbi:MAG: HAD-IA family hydrolase, partial [Pseudomonadales bacterium]|nr:HAD-IA family hydrolase [Pseudomonadales bacterium]